MAPHPGAGEEGAGAQAARILKLVPRPRFLFLFVSYRGHGTSSRSFSLDIYPMISYIGYKTWRVATETR